MKLELFHYTIEANFLIVHDLLSFVLLGVKEVNVEIFLNVFCATQPLYGELHQPGRWDDFSVVPQQGCSTVQVLFPVVLGNKGKLAQNFQFTCKFTNKYKTCPLEITLNLITGFYW